MSCRLLKNEHQKWRIKAHNNHQIQLARQSEGQHTLLLPRIPKQYHLKSVLLGSRRRICHGGLPIEQLDANICNVTYGVRSPRSRLFVEGVFIQEKLRSKYPSFPRAHHPIILGSIVSRRSRVYTKCEIELRNSQVYFVRTNVYQNHFVPRCVWYLEYFEVSSSTSYECKVLRCPNTMLSSLMTSLCRS